MSHAISFYRPPPRRRLTRWIAIAGFLALLWFLASGCTGMRPEDQAALVSLSGKLEAARARVLTASEADEGQAQLVQLGASLADVQRQRVLVEAWDTVRPLVAAGIGFLLGGT